MSASIHLAVDRRTTKGAEGFAGGTLRCKCGTLRDKGLEPHDCLNPPLMDVPASHAAEAKGTYREA